MTNTYNDIIKKRSGRPAYSLEHEKEKDWESFIANEQFNTVLRTVLRSVRGNDIDLHKSIWLEGTYGTGKSHAAAVIAHLLCDPVDAIRPWVETEYEGERFKAIREQIFAVRKDKRLFPVKLLSLQDMASVADLPLVLQSEVVRALEGLGIEAAVDTDFDQLVEHVKANPVIWDDLISRNPALKVVAGTRESLIQKLRNKDMGTFQKARDAQRSANLAIIMPTDNIAQWLIEVQELLREETEYTGLLILWDEFTDVMSDTIGISVLKALQTIAESFANIENDSFIFLISHPSAYDKADNEQKKQTDGRYHRMKYNMEPVSAFKIMSRKFDILDPMAHNAVREPFFAVHSDLLDVYTQGSNDQAETRQDLVRLFPLHPGTAMLATYYATVVGSSSRSVFEFLGQNEAIERFLDSEEAYANRDTITADYLWDFVLTAFQDDVKNYGAVTERFSTYRQHVDTQGQAAVAIFKGILLLNALNNIAGDNKGLVAPTEDNIRHLFAGTKYEGELDRVLDWLNNDSVIQRAPGGIFSVQFSALPSHEIEELKQSLANESDKFRFIKKVLEFADAGASYFDKKILQKVIRPYSFNFFSESTNDALLKDSIKRAKRNARSSDIYLALLFGKNYAEIAHLREVAKEASDAAAAGDRELRDIVMIVFDTPFGDKEYARFIEYMANYTAANSHGFLDQVSVHKNHATDMIKEWLTNAQRNNATIFVNGTEVPLSVKHMTTCLNTVVAPTLIFPAGPDAVEMLRNRAPSTFWKPQVSKEIIRTFIFATTKTEIGEVSGQMRPVQYLVQDVLDENLEWRPDAPTGHPFRAVFDLIQSKIKHADKSLTFDLGEKFDELRRPPYGLSANYASAAMVAFALRPWLDKMFDVLGKSLDPNRLVDIIAELFSVWEKGKSSNKLGIKLQTPEEGKLCKALVKAFKLNQYSAGEEISSLSSARKHFISNYVQGVGIPFWALKYMDAAFCASMPPIIFKDKAIHLIGNIVEISVGHDVKNPALRTDTLILFDELRYDLPNILAKPGNFENGFRNFLLAQPGVELREEEYERAKEFIRQNLQTSVGYWSEDEVIGALKDWRIAQHRADEERRRQEEEEERRRQEEAERERREQDAHLAREAAIEELRGNVAARHEKADYARCIVDDADEHLMRRMLHSLIELDYEFILDDILAQYDKTK